MNRWKMAFVVAVLAAIGTNAYWVTMFVDEATSYSYAMDSCREIGDRFTALRDLVIAGTAEYTQSDILHLLRQANPDAFIIEDGNSIYFEGIEFAFEDDRLTTVR